MGLSRWAIALILFTTSVLAPSAICLALALATATTVPELILELVAAGAWMALLLLANWWGFTGIWLGRAWALALALVAVLRVRSVASLPFAWHGGPAAPALTALALLGVGLVTVALLGRRHDGPSVELSFPLADGTYLVSDGGDGARSPLVNYHYGFGRHRASGVSASMRYAMDVVAIGPLGAESRGFLPRDNEAYRIWGRPLHAPCDGVVVHVTDDVPDNTAFGPNRPYGIGNHVVIRAPGDVHVAMGHMLHGSIGVRPGDEVEAGAPVGRVGNSGWTERPHLHMQAVRARDGDWWHGEPVAMRFGGRFLVRNDSLRA